MLFHAISQAITGTESHNYIRYFTAVYREDEASKARSYFAGITAESPSIKNDHRYVTHSLDV